MWKGCRDDSCGSTWATMGRRDGPSRCGRHRQWSSHCARLDVNAHRLRWLVSSILPCGLFRLLCKMWEEKLVLTQTYWKFNEEQVRLISFSCEWGRKRYVGCFRQISIWHGGVSSCSAAPEESNKQMSLSTYNIKGLAGMMGNGTIFMRGFTHN